MVVVGSSGRANRALLRLASLRDTADLRRSIDSSDPFAPGRGPADGAVAETRAAAASAARASSNSGRRRFAVAAVSASARTSSSFCAREGQPASELRIELSFGGEIDRHVKQRAGGRHQHARGSERVDGAPQQAVGRIEIRSPDVAAVDDARRKHHRRGNGRQHRVELLGSADQVHVQSVQPRTARRAADCRRAHRSRWQAECEGDRCRQRGARMPADRLLARVRSRSSTRHGSSSWTQATFFAPAGRAVPRRRQERVEQRERRRGRRPAGRLRSSKKRHGPQQHGARLDAESPRFRDLLEDLARRPGGSAGSAPAPERGSGSSCRTTWSSRARERRCRRRGPEARAPWRT